jgi:hypothetical protein
MIEIGRPKRPQRLGMVLTISKAMLVLSLMRGKHATFAKLLYGSVMRILEGMRLHFSNRRSLHHNAIILIVNYKVIRSAPTLLSTSI